MSNIHVHHIKPNTRPLFPDIREAWRYRDVAVMFGIRDMRLRYRQTAIGLVWVIIQPVLTAGAFTLVFGVVAGLHSEGQSYFLFSATGMIAWVAFSSTLTRGSASLLSNVGLISKVYFPRVLLPLSVVAAILADFGVGFVFVILLKLAGGHAPSLALLLVPAWLVLGLALAMGPALMAAALSAKYRDIQYTVPLAVQVLLYVSPVGYAVSSVPKEARIFFELNPLTGVMEGFRWSILNTAAPTTGALILSLAAAVLSLSAGLAVFSFYERQFADVI